MATFGKIILCNNNKLYNSTNNMKQSVRQISVSCYRLKRKPKPVRDPTKRNLQGEALVERLRKREEDIARQKVPTYFLLHKKQCGGVFFDYIASHFECRFNKNLLLRSYFSVLPAGIDLLF